MNKDPVESEEEKIERMGLTPDWIIHAAAFKVFQLPQPTADFPYIRGLLDPCTNSKIAPNIPAEVLYDKNDDGLKLSNAWKGYFIVLNPDFKAHVFVYFKMLEKGMGFVLDPMALCEQSDR